MHVTLKILGFETIESIPDYWSLEDYKALLQRCDIDDFEPSSLVEAEEMLFMALTDMEPDKAAKIVLDYKFRNRLRPGQIEEMSHEMLDECLPEEHPDIILHFDLFNINELLNRAFNNKFPEAKATRIRFQLKSPETPANKPPSKELILKAFALCFTKGQIITRLYREPLDGLTPFPEAESILWRVEEDDVHTYSAITSRYWIEREDFDSLFAEGDIKRSKS